MKLNTNTSLRTWQAVSAAACVALVASIAPAQTPSAQKESDGKLTVVEAEDLDGAQGGVNSVEVRIVDGEVTVKRNGKEVPKDRIKREGGRIMILDENGNELKDFAVGIPKIGDQFRFFLGDGQNQWKDWSGSFASEAPKVMLGVHMGDPSAELQYHLGLESGKATIVSGLYEGLPAHEAGIRQFDVIIKVDGKEPADSATIRKALSQKNPDDTVTFTVIQEGRTRDVKVRLAGFDAEKMRSAKLIGQEVSPQLWSFFNRQGQLDAMALPKLEGMFENQDLFVIPGQDGRKHMEMIAPRIREKLRLQLEGDAGEGNVENQLDKLDQRMAELEAMLQKLIDRQERGVR